MTNNEILKRVRFAFDFNDSKMVALFALANHRVSIEDIRGWFKKEDEPGYIHLKDRQLAIFFNGLITENRGKKEGVQTVPENRLDNNIILKKLKIALNLKTEDILEIFDLVEKPISAHELSAFLRNPKQPKFKPLMDQYLRNFLNGIQVKYRNNEGLKQ